MLDMAQCSQVRIAYEYDHEVCVVIFFDITSFSTDAFFRLLKNLVPQIEAMAQKHSGQVDEVQVSYLSSFFFGFNLFSFELGFGIYTQYNYGWIATCTTSYSHSKVSTKQVHEFMVYCIPVGCNFHAQSGILSDFDTVL